MSTDYPRKMPNATSTCAMNKEESRLALSRVPETTVNEVTEKYPSLAVGYTSSQEKHKPLRINAKNNLDDRPPGLWFPKHMTRKKKEYKDLKPEETSGLDSFRGVPDLGTQRLNANIDANANKLRNSEVQQHCHVVYEDKVVTHSTVHSLVDEKSKTVVKSMQYEDISDFEDTSQVDRKLCDTERVESAVASNYENIQYEDVSEAESPQIDNVAVEMPSFSPKVSKPNIKQHGLVQGQTQVKTISEDKLIPEKGSKKTKTPDIAQHSCPDSFETNDSENEKALGWQTNNSFSLSSVSEDEDETDDEMDDDSLVVCLSILDIKFEPVDGDQAHQELLLDDGEHADKLRHFGTSPALSGLQLPTPDPVPASAFSQIEVFDTVERFQKAKYVHLGTKKVTSPGMSTSERNPAAPQDWSDSLSEPSNSCDTEDSCDYSPGSKHNYLTVPKQLLKNLRAPTSSTTESEDEAVANFQKSHTKSRHDNNDIIILDSDSDNESDQNPENVDSWCGTVKENFNKSGIPPTEEFNEVVEVQKSYSVLPHRPEKCPPLLEHRSRSGHAKVKISEQRISHVIILSSDSEDDSHQNDEKKTSTFSSGSEENDNAPFVKQKRKTMNREDNSAEKPLHEARLSSAASSKPQYGCELEQMQNSSPDHAQQENTRHTTSKKHFTKRKRRRILSSDTEDSEDNLSDHKNTFYSNKKPQNNTVSKDSPEQQLHCSALDSNPVTHVQKSCQSSELWKPLGEHTQSNDETLMVPKTTTPIRKKYKEAPHSYRDRQESVVSKLKPASDTTPLSKVKQSSSRPSSSELRRSQSYPSTQHPYAPRKSSSPSTSKQSSARKQVIHDWENSYVPTRRDRKTSQGMEEDLRPRNSLDYRREARPGPRLFERAPRRRHASFECETPLMKRTKTEAKQWTNAINRKASMEQSVLNFKSKISL